MNYDTLVANKATAGSILNWINDSSVDPVTVLTEAQSHIYAKLRVQEMIVRTSTFAVAINAENVAMPSGCLDVIHFRWISPDLIIVEKLTVDEVDNRRLYNTDGSLVLDLPRYFAISGSNFQFPVRNNVARTAFLSYFATPASLGPSNQTNFLTDQYPRLLRTFCMGIGNEFKKDFQAANDWLMKGEDQLQNVAQAMDDSRLRAFHTYSTAE